MPLASPHRIKPRASSYSKNDRLRMAGWSEGLHAGSGGAGIPRPYPRREDTMAIRSGLSVFGWGLAAAALCASASAQINQAWVEKYADPAYPESTGSAVAFLPDGDS